MHCVRSLVDRKSAPLCRSENDGVDAGVWATMLGYVVTCGRVCVTGFSGGTTLLTKQRDRLNMWTLVQSGAEALKMALK